MADGGLTAGVLSPLYTFLGCCAEQNTVPTACGSGQSARGRGAGEGTFNVHVNMLTR